MLGKTGAKPDNLTEKNYRANGGEGSKDWSDDNMTTGNDLNQKRSTESATEAMNSLRGTQQPKENKIVEKATEDYKINGGGPGNDIADDPRRRIDDTQMG